MKKGTHQVPFFFLKFIQRTSLRLLNIACMHTNKLINETSPYLLQHAHNPVNWYPWGEEALQKAQRRK